MVASRLASILHEFVAWHQRTGPVATRTLSGSVHPLPEARPSSAGMFGHGETKGNMHSGSTVFPTWSPQTRSPGANLESTHGARVGSSQEAIITYAGIAKAMAERWA